MQKYTALSALCKRTIEIRPVKDDPQVNQTEGHLMFKIMSGVSLILFAVAVYPI